MERASSSVAIPLLCAFSLLAPLPGSAAPQTATPLELSTLAGSDQQRPAIAFDGTRHLLVWEEGGAIWGGLLEATGVVVGTRLAIGAPAADAEQATPAVAASSSGGFLVVWAERPPATVESPSPDWNIRGAQLSANGDPGLPFEISVVDDGTGTLIAAPGDQLSPAVASAGGEFLVVWQDGRTSATAPDVYGAALRADGTPFDPGSFSIRTDVNAERRPTVAASGTEYLVVWEEAALAGDSDVYAARVSLQSAVEAAFPVSAGAGDQHSPTITFGESGYVVAWNDPAESGRQVAAIRASSGAVLDETSIPIGGVDAAAPHAIASDGKGSLLVYERTGAGVLGARLSPAGAAVEFTIDDPMTSTALPNGQAIAYGGQGRYVAVHVEDVAGVASVGAFLVTTFEPLQVTVLGDGTVTSAPSGISCGATCTADFATGTAVTLTATPNAGWLVEGWSGCDPSTSCTVTMTGPRPITATFELAPPGAPGVPTFGTPSATTVTVSWTAATGADRYELERSVDGSTWSSSFPVTGTTYDDASLSPATAYHYRVRALNAAGTAGPHSEPRSVTTLPLAPLAPAPPTYTNIGSTSVRVRWAGVEGATSYDVERGLSAGGPWGSSGTAIAATELDDGTVQPNTTYWYRVLARNAGGSGDWSAASSVTTGPGAPGAPTFSGVLARSVTLLWTAPASGAESYVVERASASGTDWSEVGSTVALTWTDATVAPDTTYQYRVRGVIGTTRGDPSTAASVVTLPLPPAAPAAPTCSPVGETTVPVSWMSVAGATSYDVERTGPAGSAWISDLTATAHPDTGLSANTVYSYRVRGSNTGGDGELSPPCTATTLPAAPGTPMLSGATASSVNLSWTAPTGGADTYTVERATGVAADWTAIATGVVGTTTTDASLSANLTYRYRIRGANASGAGAPSGEASVTTLADAPGKPTFSATTATSLVVSWTAPSGGASSYDVQRAPSATGTFATIAPGVTGLTAPDSGLQPGTVYWYRIVAVTTAGTGLPSAAAQVITQPGPPGAIAFSNVAATSVRLTWGAAAGATTYKVERAPDSAGVPGSFTQIAGAVAGTSFDSIGLAANVKYWYRVRATNASGDGAFGPQASVTTMPNPPGGPSFSSVTEMSLTVAWTAPSGGAASYDLERGPTSNGLWTALATATTAVSFADSGLTAGTTYWYRVRATNLEGLKSEWTTRSVVTLPVAPAAPTFSNVGPYTLSVSWPAVTGASSYVLERAPDEGDAPGTFAQLSDKATSPHADNGLSPNTRYWYGLRAVNASGAGAWSPAATVMTVPDVPGKPELTSVTKTSVTVTWTAPAGGATSYELQRALTANGTWTTIASGGALTFTDGGLTAGTTYYYRVRALNADAGAGAWSPIASTTTLPAAPGTPWFTGVSTVSLTVNWDPIPGATIYQVERSPDVNGSAQPDGWAVRATLSGDTYYNDVGTANTVYWYRIRAATDGGFGDYSPQASVATVANAPGKPTFSGVTMTSVTVSWTVPTGGAVSYVVERAPGQLGPFAVLETGTVTTTSWTDTTLSAGTTYWYRIRAVNATGLTGAPSLAASVTTVPAPPSGAPGAPTFSAITATTVAVAWTDSSGATSYRLERAPDVSGAAGAWAQLQTVSTKSYTDRYLSANTRYWYRVLGATAGGDGSYSAPSFVITAPNAPGTPSVTSVGTSSIGLSWTEPTGGAASYELERGTSASGPWGAPVTITGRSHTDTGLAAGTTYWYRVRATNASGVPGTYSPTRTASTLASPPGGPTYSAVSATSVTLSWTAGEGATRYNVERSIGSSGTWALVASSLAGTSFTSSSLTPNTVYWFRVSAVNSAGAPGPYSPATTVMTAPSAPGAPTFTLVSTTAVTVSWTAPAGSAASYALERAPSSTGEWARVASGLTATSYQDAALVASTTYWYRVRAVNASAVESAPSAARSVTTTADSSAPPAAAPGIPTFSYVAATSLRVSWTPTANATSYVVERAPASTGPWGRIATVSGTSLTDVGRTANTTYWYRVRGTNAAGDGLQSAAASIVTAPNAPQGLTAVATSPTSATVSWTSPSGGATSYALERATSSLGPWTLVAAGITGTSRTDAALTGNTTYHYRARATNSMGIHGIYSSSSSVTTPVNDSVALPGTPGTPTFTNVTESSLQVRWTPAADATSYKVMRAPSAGGTFTQVGSTTTTAFTDTGRSANTPYAYRIVPSNGRGDGPASPIGQTSTAPNPPGTPGFTSLTANQVTVSWAAPTGGADHYIVERAPNAGGPWVTVGPAVTWLSHTDLGLTGNTTYHYRVRGASSAGTLGGYSATAAVTTPADGITATPAAPDAPVYSNVTPSSARVYWGAVSGATSYELERAIGGATAPATFTIRATGLTTTSFLDTSITANTRYWYRVRGVSAGGRGAESAASSVLTPPNAPGAPAFSAIGATGLTVSWTAPAGGAASYRVERATAAYGPWVVAATSVPTTSFVDSGLVPSTLYYYRIRATNAEGVDGGASPTRSAVTAASGATPSAGAPGTPVFSNVLATSLKLSWAAGANATSYAIERATSDTGPWIQVASGVTATTYADSGLSANTRTWYRVVSANALGPGLASGASSALTLPGQPGAPTFSAIEVTTVTVSWTAPAGGAATYQLERSTSATADWVIVATGLTTTSYADSGLTGGTTWYYRVKAANADAQLGTQSLTRSVTTAPVPGT
jgi:fibronectin type 3 domain-containing protein